ncbi:hypothetical protein HDU76_006621 [Blyttiomyces sp. JEL0837]|nr:hypothetical protein HDU76_006621 [Blyttiomyces sp. JEL0837]
MDTDHFDNIEDGDTTSNNMVAAIPSFYDDVNAISSLDTDDPDASTMLTPIRGRRQSERLVAQPHWLDDTHGSADMEWQFTTPQNFIPTNQPRGDARSTIPRDRNVIFIPSKRGSSTSPSRKRRVKGTAGIDTSHQGMDDFDAEVSARRRQTIDRILDNIGRDMQEMGRDTSHVSEVTARHLLPTTTSTINDCDVIISLNECYHLVPLDEMVRVLRLVEVTLRSIKELAIGTVDAPNDMRARLLELVEDIKKVGEQYPQETGINKHPTHPDFFSMILMQIMPMVIDGIGVFDVHLGKDITLEDNEQHRSGLAMTAFIEIILDNSSIPRSYDHVKYWSRWFPFMDLYPYPGHDLLPIFREIMREYLVITQPKVIITHSHLVAKQAAGNFITEASLSNSKSFVHDVGRPRLVRFDSYDEVIDPDRPVEAPTENISLLIPMIDHGHIRHGHRPLALLDFLFSCWNRLDHIVDGDEILVVKEDGPLLDAWKELELCRKNLIDYYAAQDAIYRIPCQPQPIDDSTRERLSEHALERIEHAKFAVGKPNPDERRAQFSAGKSFLTYITFHSVCSIARVDPEAQHYGCNDEQSKEELDLGSMDDVGESLRSGVSFMASAMGDCRQLPDVPDFLDDVDADICNAARLNPPPEVIEVRKNGGKVDDSWMRKPGAVDAALARIGHRLNEGKMKTMGRAEIQANAVAAWKKRSATRFMGFLGASWFDVRLVNTARNITLVIDAAGLELKALPQDQQHLFLKFSSDGIGLDVGLWDGRQKKPFMICDGSLRKPSLINEIDMISKWKEARIFEYFGGTG